MLYNVIVRSVYMKYEFLLLSLDFHMRLSSIKKMNFYQSGNNVEAAQDRLIFVLNHKIFSVSVKWYLAAIHLY